MLEAHLQLMAQMIREGLVIPFLGAGVNLCERREGETFRLGENLPSGRELACYLSDLGFLRGYRKSIPDPGDLVGVSQQLAVLTGPATLYDALHRVFDHDYPPTMLHRFLAELPGELRRQGRPQHQLIVTANFDTLLEEAFADAGEPADVVVYVADGPQRGRFVHREPSGRETCIDTPNKYDGLSLDRRTVIVKIHGAVDRRERANDSYVITEDHYIDYLTNTDISQFIPVKLASRIMESAFLFLGYSLRDWNLRVILHRIWKEQKLHRSSWAVQRDPDPIEQKSWAQRNVEIIPVELDEYVAGLRDVLCRDGAEAVA